METDSNNSKILIERVDKICDFVNKIKKDYKNREETIKVRDEKIVGKQS